MRGNRDEADYKPQINRILFRILTVAGSDGLPSCGGTDAGKIGQGEDRTTFLGGASMHIEPGTSPNNIPLHIQHRLVPDRLSKNPRNDQGWRDKHHK